jgi:hypothetical protein
MLLRPTHSRVIKPAAITGRDSTARYSATLEKDDAQADPTTLLGKSDTAVEPQWSVAEIDFIHECSDCGVEIKKTLTRPERRQ